MAQRKSPHPEQAKRVEGREIIMQPVPRRPVMTATTEPTDRVLVITRVFDAPREAVFRAWTDPAQARQWMGPRGFTATHNENDGRVGGRWRLCLRRDATGEELWQGGVNREIVVPERLVFTFAWDGENGRPGPETLVTITFAESG